MQFTVLFGFVEAMTQTIQYTFHEIITKHAADTASQFDAEYGVAAMIAATMYTGLQQLQLLLKETASYYTG